MSRIRTFALKHINFKDRPARSMEDIDLVLSPDSGNADDKLTASLHNLLPEDIDLKKTSHAKKKKSSGAMARRIVLIFCILVFVVCAVYLVWNISDKARGNAMYDDVAEQFGDIFADEQADDGAVSRLSSFKSSQRILCLKDRLNAGENYMDSGYDADSKIDEMRAKLASLAESFPDLYGWITIGGTAVNHPVVQGTDNNYYLNASPYKKPLVNGSIFVDYRNEKEIMRNFNTVLYGHNLTGGGMFHDVQTIYGNEELFRSSLIYVYTMDGAYVYEPFAVYEANASYQYFRTEFATTAEFVAFAEEMQSNTIYKKDMEFLPTDRIITLSTCTNRSVDGRYALQAKLVQVIH